MAGLELSQGGGGRGGAGVPEKEREGGGPSVERDIEAGSPEWWEREKVSPLTLWQCVHAFLLCYCFTMVFTIALLLGVRKGQHSNALAEICCVDINGRRSVRM